MAKYCFMKKENFENLSAKLFEILANNMDGIAPTGNPREDDFKTWYSDVSEKVENDEVKFVLATDEESDEIVAFFEFHTTDDTLVMDEIQISGTYHVKGVFREIYAFVFDNIGTDYSYVEAAANKLNTKSIGVLHTLGLKVVGELHNGGCALLRGDFADLLAWHRRK